MTPENFKKVRMKYKKTQHQFGVDLGMPVKSAGRSVRAYESGERKVPGILSLLAEYVKKYGFLNAESVG